jgi:secreted trypsin-like serine protease
VLQNDARIVGGKTANNSDYPFFVELFYDETHICGASLINPLWTLTAAHCVEFGEPGQFTLLFSNSVNSSVSDIILHPAWALDISPIYDGDFVKVSNFNN